MSVQFLTGKPGGGKTLFAVRLIVQELVHGKRNILTNVPLNIGRLNEYIQEKHPGVDARTVQRVTVMTDAQTGKFYRYRGGDIVLPQDGESLDYTLAFANGPVMYVIDEIHMFFNAREWAKTGKTALAYLSQHRHLGDDVVCITQSIRNVDRQFRSIAQDFTHLRNYSKEKFFGLRMPSRFVYKTYLSENEGDAKQPMMSGTFRLDASGLASCYDTSAGVGLVGACAADTGQKTKGPSIWWLAVVLVVLAFLAWKLPQAFYHKAATSIVGVANESAEKVADTFKVDEKVAPKVSTNHVQVAHTNDVEIVGVTRLRGVFSYYLSDGTQTYSKAPGVTDYSDRMFVRSNILYKFGSNVPRGTSARFMPDSTYTMK